MNIFNFLKTKKAQVERSPRVRLLLSDGAKLETSHGSFPILNLSETGLAFLVEDGSLPDLQEGRLVLGQDSLKISFKIARRSGKYVGVQFMGEGRELRALLRRQFTEEFRAKEMTEVDPSHLNEVEAKGKPRWFYAPGNYELFFLEEEGEIQKVEIEWDGRVISAKKGESARYGTIAPEERQKPGHAKSALVRWLGELNEAERNRAERIVENVPGLDEATRDKIISLLRV